MRSNKRKYERRLAQWVVILFPGNQYESGIPCTTKDASLGGLSVVVDEAKLEAIMALAESLASGSQAECGNPEGSEAESALPPLFQVDISVPPENPWTRPHRVVVRCRLANLTPFPVAEGVRIGLQFLNMTTADRKTMEWVLEDMEG
ncbi:MAG: PilZ domain-containing protein [Rhodocyclaceae bacterium]|nr:PilZ domain-containing protein [Rhodocyclaceae bacterium]